MSKTNHSTSSNIFQNAYLGQPFKTKDGRIAIYLGESCYHELAIFDGDDYYSIHKYNKNGQLVDRECPDYDIVEEMFIPRKVSKK